MQRLFKLFIAFCISLVLFSCATVDSRESSAEQATTVVVDAEESTSDQTVASVPDGVDTKTETPQAKKNTAMAVVGVVVATAVTIWAVTEYIEEKVVPVVVTLVVASLLYEASRNSKSATEN